MPSGRIVLGRILIDILHDHNAIYGGNLRGFAGLNISTNLLSSILARSRSLLIWTRSPSLSGDIQYNGK